MNYMKQNYSTFYELMANGYFSRRVHIFVSARLSPFPIKILQVPDGLFPNLKKLQTHV